MNINSSDIINVEDIAKLLHCKNSTAYALRRKPDFPQSIELESLRPKYAYRLYDVKQWAIQNGYRIYE